MWNEPPSDELAKLPNAQETENVPLEQRVVRAHFFFGGCDWYAVEYDPAARRFFGYAILNDDYECAEWGYFALDELRELQMHGIEVDYDLHWQVRPAREVDRIRRGMGWSQSGSLGH